MNPAAVIRTRFAPSPTGRLHLGHALAARVARDFAKSSPGGVFLLRHEDIDGGRVRDDFFREIEDDLRWLGLDWDEPALRQSGRAAAHRAAFDALRERGLVYPCFCTRREIRDEIARIGGAPHQGEAAPYPGTCRALSTDERNARIAAGLPHAWRLDAAAAADVTGPLAFTDLRHGTHAVEPARLGDVVLARKDIGIAYHLAVVVDDAWQGVTHVTRGEDLLDSTHVHRLLQALLGISEPVWLHHRLVTGAGGKRLAKRDDALSLASLRAAGNSADAVMAMLAPFLL